MISSISDREIVAKLAQNSDSNYISVEKAAEVLNINTNSSAIRLASLTKKGWLLRAKRGIYLILPIEAVPGQMTTSDDSWILASKIFSPCYIGGWSAAEHWGLTEQLFNSTLVITSGSIRQKQVTILNQKFRLFATSNSKLSNLSTIWRGNSQVQVSSKERTLVDCLTFPELCGGVQHLKEMMQNYSSEQETNYQEIIKQTKEFGNGTTWKRLGYLSELLWPNIKEISEIASKSITAGYSKLDPGIKDKGTLIRKWHLWINVSTE